MEFLDGDDTAVGSASLQGTTGRIGRVFDCRQDAELMGHEGGAV
ncbi:hypothetical protein WL1483_2269 [Aeromonas schubertii]|uniref:Uncharacterized protein n=1 Tax=Aeromonas schubertii TaxID=652 RepID=A0A0S2SJ22_9GAMM|nr:hypothetical protein WL1483_2269 [Aeromonas schubertii]